MERARGLAGSLFPLCPSRQTQLARFPSPGYVRCCSRCLVNRSFLRSHSDHSLCHMFPFSQMLADGNIDTYLNYPEYTSPLSLGPLPLPLSIWSGKHPWFRPGCRPPDMSHRHDIYKWCRINGRFRRERSTFSCTECCCFIGIDIPIYIIILVRIIVDAGVRLQSTGNTVGTYGLCI